MFSLCMIFTLNLARVNKDTLNFKLNLSSQNVNNTALLLHQRVTFTYKCLPSICPCENIATVPTDADRPQSWSSSLWPFQVVLLLVRGCRDISPFNTEIAQYRHNKDPPLFIHAEQSNSVRTLQRGVISDGKLASCNRKRRDR